VGGPSRVVGGSDRSGVAGTAVWDRSVGGRGRRVGGRVADLVFRRFPSPTMAGNVANRDCTNGAMEQRPAARKKVTKNVRSPNERRRRMVPHVGIDLPSSPESCGPAGCAFERCGRTLHTAPVSTLNCCLLSSSVAVGMVLVAKVAVLLIRARGRREGRRAAASGGVSRGASSPGGGRRKRR
jgi:hypothetical protein